MATYPLEKLLGVSVLADIQTDVCTQFSKKATERFTGFTR
jgi:hypothetical protein